MAEIRILVGLPGCGKSTYTQAELRKDPSWSVLGTDALIDEYAADHGLTYTEAFERVNHKALKKRFIGQLQAAILDNRNIMIDRTNMTPKGRAEILKYVPETYTRTAVVFSLTDAEHRSRLNGRAAATGKVIPAFVIKGMANSYVAPSTEEFSRVTYIRD